jgi:hypothetical protein
MMFLFLQNNINKCIIYTLLSLERIMIELISYPLRTPNIGVISKLKLLKMIIMKYLGEMMYSKWMS